MRKYFLYALGEIALVMIGILLALQINNWNEEQKQQELLNTYLSSLKEDLQNDIRALEYTKTVGMFRYY